MHRFHFNNKIPISLPKHSSKTERTRERFGQAHIKCQNVHMRSHGNTFNKYTFGIFEAHNSPSEESPSQKSFGVGDKSSTDKMYM